MKRAFEIAKECGVGLRDFYSVMEKENIKSDENKLLTSDQEFHILKILYFEGKIKEILMHSKMNYDVNKMV